MANKMNLIISWHIDGILMAHQTNQKQEFMSNLWLFQF